MRWAALVLGIGLVVTGLYLRWQEPSQRGLEHLAAEPSLLRRTDRGPVVGARSPAGAQVWLNIPYAAPPEGELRWRAPRKPLRWSTPKDTVSFGPVCPQFASPFAPGDHEPGTFIGDEDCLSLNVFAPRGADSGSGLPVMVYLHGGGNTVGGARIHDASRFAQEQGVIVVTFNYRLGPLGWFSHAALRRTAGNALDASGNFAVLDMLAVLHWVQDNIAAFGGNADRVTLFGESAGGRNIYALLASPLARGLFHGAIVQSGSAGTQALARAENPADAPQPGHRHGSHELLLAWLEGRAATPDRAAAAEVLERLGDLDLVAFMRGIPLQELMAPLAREGGMYSAPTLFRDGAVLPERPLLEVFSDPEAFSQVPVIAGTNRDEAKLFMAVSERYTQQRLGLFPAPRDPAQYDLVAGLKSRKWKAVGVDEPLARMARAAPELPLFAYRFDWDAMRANWLVDLPGLLGAAHGLELDFLFAPQFSRAVPGVFHEGNRRGVEALGQAMRDYWAGFAYSGTPGSGRSAAQPLWPRWRPDEPLNMILDAPADGGLHTETLTVTVEDVKTQLTNAAGVGGRLRCALYVDLFLSNNGLEELFSVREYQGLGCAPFPSWSLAGESR